MKKIDILKLVGSFAEDKDAAAKLRKDEILPVLAAGGHVEFNFSGVTLTTQSFIHALISEALRQNGEPALKRMTFKKCDVAVRGIIETVVQYTLETLDDSEE
jgi:hypothetical protein